jgi:hypothetical protein
MYPLRARHTSAAIIIAGVAFLSVLACPAFASHLGSQLAAAEADESAASQEVTNAAVALGDRRKELVRAERKAAPWEEHSAELSAELDAIEGQVTAERESARAEVEQGRASYSGALEVYRSRIAILIGLMLGICVLLVVAIRFASIRSDSRVENFFSEAQSGLRVGSITATVVLTGVFAPVMLVSGIPVLQAFGAFFGLVVLGLLAVLFALWRSLDSDLDESVEDTRRRRGVGALSVVLVALVALAALLARPVAPVFSPYLLSHAEYAAGDPLDPPTHAMLAAQEELEPIEEEATKLGEVRDDAQQAVNRARNALRQAQSELDRAQLAVRRVSRRIASEVSASAPSSGGGISGGGWTSCTTAPSNIPVPPGSPLDGDGDGIGCES